MTNFLKSAISNAKCGYKTTILGVVLLISAIMSIFNTEATWMEITPIVLIGVGLIISPDKIKDKINNKDI